MKKQSFIFSSAILILSAVVTKLMGAFFRIPLANMLGGTGMGYFSGAYGIFMAVYAVSVTGLPTAVAKLVAENSALGQYGNIRKIKHTALGFFGITGLIFSVLLIMCAYPFCLLTSGTEAVPSVLMIAPSIFFCCATSVYRGYYEGLRNMFPTAFSQIVEGLFKLGAGLAFCIYVIRNPEKFDGVSRIFGNCSIISIAAAAAVLGITVSSAMGMVFLIARDKICGDGISEEQIYLSGNQNDDNRSIINQLIKIALPVAAGALVTNLTSVVDLVTITSAIEMAVRKAPDYFISLSVTENIHDLPNFMFGSFTGLAVTVFNLIPSFTNMFGKGILPNLSEAFATQNKAAIKANTEKALISTALIAFPAGAGICALSENILQFLFPSRIAETRICASSLSILGIAVMFLCISSTAFSILQAAGKPQIPVRIMLAGVAAKLIGNLALVAVPEININGAAMSTLLCYIIICIVTLYYIIKLTDIAFVKLFVVFCKICYCSVICALSANLTRNILSNAVGTSIVLIISILCGVIFYIICAYLLGIFTKSTLKLLIS